MVSVIIPVYNRDKYIERTIKSVLRQTMQEFEIVIVDDGSNDKSPDIIKQLCGEFPSKIRAFRQENKGAAAARNLGVRMAKGDYIAFLDSDDTWEPNKLLLQMESFQKDGNVALVYSSYDVKTLDYVICPNELDLYYKNYPQGNVLPELLQRCFISMNTAVVKKQVFEAVRGLDETILLGEDYDLWLRIAKDYHVSGIQQVLATYFRHNDNLFNTDLGRDEPSENQIVQNFVKRFPETAHLVPEQKWTKRLARPYFERGYGYLYVGDIKKARLAFWKALKFRPVSLAYWRFLLLAWLPIKIFSNMKNKKRT